MKFIPLLLLCGCIATESLRVSQDCIDQHAESIKTACSEIARTNGEAAVPLVVREMVQGIYDDAGKVSRWTALTKEHLGPVAASIDITNDSEEVGAMALYRNRIALERTIKKALPLPGLKGSTSGGGLVEGLLMGGGPLATILGVAYGVARKRKKQLNEAKQENNHLKKAVDQGISVIATSQDPEIRKRAASHPNLVIEYAEKKEKKYHERARCLLSGDESA